MNGLSQLVSEPTNIPDHSGDKANILDLLLTANSDIYCNPILDSSLGNSDHCLITLQHNVVSHQERSSSRKVFLYSKTTLKSSTIAKLPLKKTLAHLHALLPLKLTFSHQPLLPVLMTKISSLLSIPRPPSQCPY